MSSTPPQHQGPHANAYLRTRVLTASPEELRLLLLDGAIKFATQARDAIGRQDFEALYAGSTSCRNIVFELLTTIRDDLQPQLAAQVKALYSFLYSFLVEASHERDRAKFDKAIELLQYERETWVLLMEKVREERQGAGAAPNMAAPNRAEPLHGSRAPMSIEG